MTPPDPPPEPPPDAPVEPTADVPAHEPAPDDPVGRGPGPALVEWEATARRLRRSSTVLLSVAVVAWVVSSLVTGAWRLATLGNWLGLALGLMFLVEVVVVGGSAVRGLLRAGDRGERLSSHDVGLFPPTPRRHTDDD